VNKRIDQTEEKLTEWIDKLGYQLAELTDDAPTIKEFDKLEKRVTKLEKTVTSNWLQQAEAGELCQEPLLLFVY
jgi:polyhydroxyalkanoate synthesis regulator phasin